MKIKLCVCCFYEDSITTTKRKFFHFPLPLCFMRTGGQGIFMNTLKHEKDSQASWLFSWKVWKWKMSRRRRLGLTLCWFSPPVETVGPDTWGQSFKKGRPEEDLRTFCHNSVDESDLRSLRPGEAQRQRWRKENPGLLEAFKEVASWLVCVSALRP